MRPKNLLPDAAVAAFRLDLSRECRPKSECVSARGNCCSDPERGTRPPKRLLEMKMYKNINLLSLKTFVSITISVIVPKERSLVYLGFIYNILNLKKDTVYK